MTREQLENQLEYTIRKMVDWKFRHYAIKRMAGMVEDIAKHILQAVSLRLVTLEIEDTCPVCGRDVVPKQKEGETHGN